MSIKFAFFTANVTINVTIMVVNVVGGSAFCFANIANSITSIVVNVCKRCAGCATFITISITIVGVFMCGFTVELATYNITNLVAFVIVNVFNFTCFSTADGVTEGIASVAPYVINRASCTAYVTVYIANSIVCVFGNLTGFQTNVTFSIASIVIFVCGCAHQSAFVTHCIAIVIPNVLGQTGKSAT